MTTVSTLLDYIKDDIKETTTDRNQELIRYMNRVIRNVIVPNLIALRSEIGLKEWTTTETVANDAIYPLPSDFKAVYSFWLAEIEHSGTAQAGTSNTITLATNASSTDDTYNAYKIRLTGGTGEDQEKMIIDYAGSTKIATVESTWSTTPDNTTTYAIFKPSEVTELEQKDMDVIIYDYSDVSKPEVYAIQGTNLYLGNIPDDTYILGGLYFYEPATLSSTSDTIPYNEFFDDLIIDYTSFRALNRDEYNLQIEATFMQDLSQKLRMMIRRRNKKFQQARIRGSTLEVED